MSTLPSAAHAADQQHGNRHIALIVAKGGLDEVYPAFILANAARAAGLEASIFFTFYGLYAITEKKVDHLHVNLTGNAVSPVPTMLAGLPGVESAAAKAMEKMMADLDVPGPREMITMLSDAGCQLFACELAMKMFRLEEDDLLPEVDAVLTAGDFYDRTWGAQIIFT
ncbi:MAG: DsrE/DsrF/DrsH-like family protein [Alphaproteobacteria bacterium]|nr:DsrE/DsrF/DrsH-like family protein [Alphaproteobacteria bacterium]